MPDSLLRPDWPTKIRRPSLSTSPPSSVPGAWMKDTRRWFASTGAMCDSLGPPRFRPGSRDNRDLVEDDGHVFDEDGVGQIVEGGQGLDAAAGARQGLLVRAVLRPRAIEVDRLPLEVRQFASGDAGADSAGDRDLHAFLSPVRQGLKP